MPATSDTIARRYRVLEEAGRGGMGSVWRCVDERLGREVAVKQVGRLPGESVTHQARALREARSSAALHHPHVVSIYDAVAEQDHIWLVMEYVPGRTLAEIVRDDGPLPPERAARIGAQVADGLAAAHTRGTIHRDVKPGNVLVQDDGTAKISDFGIARTAGDDTLTQTGMMIGTPAYFAPEVARGGETSPASDVWALGATLFSAVEGGPPYGTSANPLALLSAIAVEEPAEPRRAGVLAEPLRRMLDRDPESRWSMTVAADALRRVHDGPATVATGEDTPGPHRRRGALVLLGVAVVVLLAALAAFALLGDDPGGSPTADETTPRSTPGSTPGSTPENTPGKPESSAPAGDGTPAATGGGSPAGFVRDYYAALPGDTRTGYARLSPSYRADLSYGEYDGFWSTVDSVAALDTSVAGPRAVDVTLRYNGDEQEVRRIYLERGADGWLIADDEVVG